MRSRIQPSSTRARPVEQPQRKTTRSAPKSQRPPLLLVFVMWVLMVFTIIPEGFNYDRIVPEQNNYGNGAANLAATATAAPTMPTEGSPLSRTIWLGLLAFGLVVVASRYTSALDLLRQTNRFLLLFIALCFVSVAWSIEPAVTIRRIVRVVTVTLDAYAFSLLAKSPRNFQSILRPIFTAILIGSIIFVLADPKLAVEQLNQAELIGAWHGLTTQKNVLGSLAATTFLLWLHAWLSKESPWWRALAGLAIAGVCLLKSRSSTSLMAAAFASVLLLFLLRSPATLRRYMPYLITLFVGVLLVYSLAVLDLLPGSGLLLTPITALTGKDLTFSGRTAIWQVINENIALHPWLGGGYGAYWTGLPNSPSMVMLQRVFFYPTESHNGYLDVINDLGFAGAACLVGYLFVYVWQGLKIFSTLRSQGALYFTLLFDQMVGNLSEARWFNSLSNDFMVMTIATIAMAKLISDSRRRLAKDTKAGTTSLTNRLSYRDHHQ